MTATDLPSSPPAAAGLSPAAGQAARRAQELHLLAAYAATARRGPLVPTRVSVSQGSTVLVAGVDAGRSLFVEPHLLSGPIGPDRVWAVVQDLFKLALVARTHPGARAVLLVAGEPAAASARRVLASAPSLGIVEIQVVAV